MGTKVQTKKGPAVALKQDIFKRLIWFAYEDAPAAWVSISVDRTLEIIVMNKAGERPESLEAEMVELAPAKTEYANAVGQDSLTRFDTNRPQKRKKKRKPFRKNTNANRPAK